MERKQYSIISMERTGKWLRYVCQTKKISAKRLCSYIGMGSPQSIYAWFCGKTLPSLDNFYILAQIVSMPLEELIVSQEEFLPNGFCERAGCKNVRVLMYSIRFAL